MEKAEYLKLVKKHLDERIRENVKSGTEVSERKYLDNALAYTKMLYKDDPDRRTSKQRHFWSSGELHGITQMWESMRPELEKHIQEALMKYRSRRMVAEINALSAEALIDAAMKEAGLKHLFEAQTYRAKVRVKITDKNKIIIYLNYKKIHEQLPKAIESLKVLVSTLESMNYGTTIQKIMWYENF